MIDLMDIRNRVGYSQKSGNFAFGDISLDRDVKVCVCDSVMRV